ncbi:unnamed protein product [Prorocentrum cordatum]|uniref:Membrane-associated protein n=1 Tax=Prorocentrum cordatum TaxID=2364126 RepID=A0ABN9S407_9DINO|nr:unnamed protein product [Polarella glacialis]
MAPLKASPTLFGVVSLVAALEVCCLVHLLCCIFVLAQVSSVHSAEIGGVLVAPALQCMLGAWFLAGIPVIVCAGVGVIYHVESHMTAYMAYLVGTSLWGFAWLALFVHFGSACKTTYVAMENAPSFACGVSNGITIFAVVVALAAVIFTAYLASCMKEHIRSRNQTELIRYQEPWQAIQTLADDVGAGQAAMTRDARSQAYGSAGTAYAPAAPGPRRGCPVVTRGDVYTQVGR